MTLASPTGREHARSETCVRIAFIANMITPYQTPLFERIAERDDCDLLVLYETTVEPNRRRRPCRPLRFPHVVLDSWSVDLAPVAVGTGIRLVSDIYLHLPKRPLRALKRFGPDVVVASGGGIWFSPTNIAALAPRGREGWAFAPRWESFPRIRPTLARRLAEPWVRRFMRAGDAWV